MPKRISEVRPTFFTCVWFSNIIFPQINLWRLLCSEYLCKHSFFLCEKFQCVKFRYKEVIHKKHFLVFLKCTCLSDIYEHVQGYACDFSEKGQINVWKGQKGQVNKKLEQKCTKLENVLKITCNILINTCNKLLEKALQMCLFDYLRSCGLYIKFCLMFILFLSNAFSTQPQYCLTLSWIELQMLLSRNLSKQFWCPVGSTKNSIF